MSLPSHVGRYAVRRRIGSGGFATVWLAYDEQLDAPVALKVLADNWTEDHHVRTRFLEEGRYLRRVESPHVVTVYDAGQLDDGRPYLVMTYADQGTLADRLAGPPVGPSEAPSEAPPDGPSDGPPVDTVPSLAESVEIVRQVGVGLQALHDRGILHRDVKPANVLFRTVDVVGGRSVVRAMLGDLGLGKALDASSRLTMIAGTPSFVAPEQAQGETPDSRADQYSLAVLTYLLLAGRTPWQHTDLRAAADPAPPPPVSTQERPFSPEVEAVVGRALSRERDDRWGSVTDYVEALRAALGDPTDDGDPVGRSATVLLAADPHRTQPGARPTPVPAVGPLPEPVAPTSGVRGRTRRRSAVLAALVCLVLLAGGAAAGWFGVTAMRGERTLTDERDVLSVTVPRGWGEVQRAPWTPPGQPDGATDVYPALSAGTGPDWRTAPDGEGVFLAVLPLDELPSRLPRHPDCTGPTDTPVVDRGAEPSRTVVYTECPGVVVERLVQVAGNRVLWVQVRAADRAGAVAVLTSVTDRI